VSWSFVKREWGAVTFVLTVLLGIVIVPIALYFGNQNPAAAAQPTPLTPAASAPASAPRQASPTP
jgi:hypothetical protein